MSSADSPPRGTSRESFSSLSAETDRRRAQLEAAMEERRFRLLEAIVGHPRGAPSKAELRWTSELNPATLYRQLSRLEEVGLVERGELAPGERHEGLPYVFYRPTEDGRRLVESTPVFAAVETLEERYTALEKPADVREAERAPRPFDA
ncbi:helix-turn-helix transcriptional regulator [Halomarina ordinaria]|uniref:Helix-turn-helix transcriptional regulator n=1 Tax=Halomarina ordinaria TaxID=3033939 RepID=A0ABD5U3Y5_9EURY|nr:helix-turn-helix transcriptional regulator [Halomarina sp. PSRA2]